MRLTVDVLSFLRNLMSSWKETTLDKNPRSLCSFWKEFLATKVVIEAISHLLTKRERRGTPLCGYLFISRVRVRDKPLARSWCDCWLSQVRASDAECKSPAPNVEVGESGDKVAPISILLFAGSVSGDQLGGARAAVHMRRLQMQQGLQWPVQRLLLRSRRRLWSHARRRLANGAQVIVFNYRIVTGSF